jgi:hypothetical protein
MNMIDMPNTQLRGEKWDDILATLKEKLLDESLVTVHVANNLTVRKIQDKWADIRSQYHEVKRAIGSTGAGGSIGDERWPLYSLVNGILVNDPSENSGVNIESMASGRRDGVTLELHTQVQDTSEEIEDVEQERQPRSSTARSTRRINRQTRQREEEDRNEEWICRLEQIHRDNMDRATEASEALAASMREQNEIMLREQREQHNQTLISLANIIRESDERWLSILAPNRNPTNRNNSQNTDNTSENNN